MGRAQKVCAKKAAYKFGSVAPFLLGGITCTTQALHGEKLFEAYLKRLTQVIQFKHNGTVVLECMLQELLRNVITNCLKKANAYNFR